MTNETPLRSSASSPLIWPRRSRTCCFCWATVSVSSGMGALLYDPCCPFPRVAAALHCDRRAKDAAAGDLLAVLLHLPEDVRVHRARFLEFLAVLRPPIARPVALGQLLELRYAVLSETGDEHRGVVGELLLRPVVDQVLRDGVATDDVDRLHEPPRP